MSRILIALGAAALAIGHALASPAVTATPTIMRASPSSKAAVVQAIPANAEIEVDGCGKVWCHASWRSRAGFVRVEAVAALPAGEPYPPEPPPPVVVAPFYPPPYPWGPGYYYGPGVGFGFGYHHWRY